MFEVDCRGLACPIPVVKVDKAIAQHPGQPISVLLDSMVSRENVSRLAKSKGYGVKVETLSHEFKLELTPARSGG
jgi:tRNA 2-thiouridine synthesizing protein A